MEKDGNAMLTLKEFLQSEVKPALGCTEPGAVALAIARASQELESRNDITAVHVIVSDSIYKNGMDVGIPGANGARGNALAAALAVICGRAEYGLEVLKDCCPEDLPKAMTMRDELVQIVCHAEKHGVYVEATVETATDSVTCFIEEEHSNITRVVKNGTTVFLKTKKTESIGSDKTVQQLIGELSYLQVLEIVDQMDEEDVRYIMAGVEMNKHIAEYGLQQDSLSGLSLGKALKAVIEQHHLEKDLGYLIKSYSYAASDARMAGVQLPVMSSAGSGNHGITAILPIALAGEKLGKSEQEIAAAIIVSHLSTSFVKSRLGRLSPVCGCAVAAGAGATAGLTYLFGGNLQQVAKALQTQLANTAGMICDGAKETCSLKVGTASGEAYTVALLALQGVGIDAPQGVVEASIEKTTDNVGRINREGMSGIDKVMIDILETRNGKSPSI